MWQYAKTLQDLLPCDFDPGKELFHFAVRRILELLPYEGGVAENDLQRIFDRVRGRHQLLLISFARRQIAQHPAHFPG